MDGWKFLGWSDGEMCHCLCNFFHLFMHPERKILNWKRISHFVFYFVFSLSHLLSHLLLSSSFLTSPSLLNKYKSSEDTLAFYLPEV